MEGPQLLPVYMQKSRCRPLAGSVYLILPFISAIAVTGTIILFIITACCAHRYKIKGGRQRGKHTARHQSPVMNTDQTPSGYYNMQNSNGRLASYFFYGIMNSFGFEKKLNSSWSSYTAAMYSMWPMYFLL